MLCATMPDYAFTPRDATTPNVSSSKPNNAFTPLHATHKTYQVPTKQRQYENSTLHYPCWSLLCHTYTVRRSHNQCETLLGRTSLYSTKALLCYANATPTILCLTSTILVLTKPLQDLHALYSTVTARTRLCRC